MESVARAEVAGSRREKNDSDRVEFHLVKEIKATLLVCGSRSTQLKENTTEEQIKSAGYETKRRNRRSNDREGKESAKVNRRKRTNGVKRGWRRGFGGHRVNKRGERAREEEREGYESARWKRRKPEMDVKA